MGRILWRIMCRDLRLALCGGGVWWQSMGFVAGVWVCFALAGAQDVAWMAQSALPVLWVTVLLSVLLSLPHVYATDAEDGSLEQFLSLPVATEVVVCAKLLAQWLYSVGPVCVILPLWHLGFAGAVGWPWMVLTLMIGGLGLVALVHIVAVLLAHSHVSSVLAVVLIFPLAVPLLIFGVQASAAGTLHTLAFGLLCGQAGVGVATACLLGGWILRAGYR